MATAMAFPNKEKGGRGKKSGLNPEFLGVDSSYVNKARYVLRNNPTAEGKDFPDRCLAIMAGTLTSPKADRIRQ
jgi:hypothetical protein